MLTTSFIRPVLQNPGIKEGVTMTTVNTSNDPMDLSIINNMDLSINNMDLSIINNDLSSTESIINNYLTILNIVGSIRSTGTTGLRADARFRV